MEVMEWWRQEGNVWAIVVLVNDHDERKVFWEASSVEIHVATEFDLWKIGIHMEYKVINFCSQSICNFEKKSSKLTHPHINLVSSEDLQKPSTCL